MSGGGWVFRGVEQFGEDESEAGGRGGGKELGEGAFGKGREAGAE